MSAPPPPPPKPAKPTYLYGEPEDMPRSSLPWRKIAPTAILAYALVFLLAIYIEPWVSVGMGALFVAALWAGFLRDIWTDRI